MNKTNLLAACAIVALTLTSGSSMAQQEHRAPSPADKMAPAEKIAPPGTKQAPAATHQNDGRTGEAPQHTGRPDTTGQAPHEERPNERASEPKRSEPEQAPKSERNGQHSETGQAPREDRRGRTTEDNRPTGQAPREDGRNRASQQNTPGEEKGRTGREENHTTTGQGAAGAHVNITPEKRTRIHETIIRERNVPRVASVNFDVSVGTRVSRDVRFAALPQTIVEIEPEWRGFEYFMVGDQIVIVDPGSMEIVAIIDA